MKLTAVSRKLSASTIHAIESGTLVPSPRTLDLLTAAFHLPSGSLDLLSLTIDQGPHLQRLLVGRLLRDGVTTPNDIRRVLIEVLAHRPTRNTVSRSTIQYLIAWTWLHEGETATAIDLLQSLYTTTRPLRGILRMDILSTLARAYLIAHKPQQALPILLEATRNHTRGRGWESAMYNLGLTWWKLGQYDPATTQWKDAETHVSDMEIKAHIHVGLGNADLRSGHVANALTHYRAAFNLYHDTSSPAEILALNNIAMCHIQEQAWDAAHAALEAIPGEPPLSPSLQGQIWATRAELARSLGRHVEACQAIAMAKTLIGDSPVSSWFTVRFLEIELTQNSVPIMLDEIEAQLQRVPDPLMVVALRVRLLQLALAKECWNEAKRETTNLVHSLPIIT